ncbi:hypothetical protein M405DRAFT_826820, partial [Rhizopogon salebrosus TDB-379]
MCRQTLHLRATCHPPLRALCFPCEHHASLTNVNFATVHHVLTSIAFTCNMSHPAMSIVLP